MERLTTDKKTSEMNMTELALNSCYVKNGEAWYRDYEKDISIRDLARELYQKHMYQKHMGIDVTDNDDDFDEELTENLFWGYEMIDGLIALFYRNLWAMAELREKLKRYEDAEEQGLLLRLPCKVGDMVYEVQELRKRIQPYTIISIQVSKCSVLFGWELKDGKGIYSNINGFCDYAIGKSVFLTKEEAAAKLKEMEGSEDKCQS